MTSSTLFPLETQAPTEPEPLPESRRVTVAGVAARSALTRQSGPSARWFDWSANPYRGCEIGCGYCYARGFHRFLGHERPEDFQERIYVRQGFAQALRRDLRTRVRPGEHVAFGTATDPYQPIERREEVMRPALREVARASGLHVSITTKSSLVLRDVDLLREVARRNSLQVNVTITTPDRRLARFLEPRAPAPGVRLATLRRLRREGLRAGAFLMPVLPGVTDADADLRALFAALAGARASFVAHQTVFLEGAAREHFLPLLRRRYPRVAARYEVWTLRSRSLPGDVRSDVARRVVDLAREFGVPCGASTGDPARAPPARDLRPVARSEAASPPFDPARAGEAQRQFAFAG